MCSSGRNPHVEQAEARAIRGAQLSSAAPDDSVWFMVGLQVHETIVALTELERTRKREVLRVPREYCRGSSGGPTAPAEHGVIPRLQQLRELTEEPSGCST